MTRRQTKKNLQEIEHWFKMNPGPWGQGHPDFFKAWRLMWYQEHYNRCLDADIDPDSIMHHADIKEGKGKKWRS